MPIYKKVNKDFFKKWTPDMAYVLGFFAADGYITVNKRGGQFWCIQITDGELLKQIRKTIKSDHAISERFSNQNHKRSYRLQIGSIEMCNDLRLLGYKEKKTKSLAVPHIPNKYLSDFVRGYFDGDGNVWTGYMHKERKKITTALIVVFTSCSVSFLQKLKISLFQVAGLKGGSLYTSRGNYSRLQYSTHDSLKLCNFMYNGLGISKLFLKRKKDIFEKYIVDNAVVV